MDGRDAGRLQYCTRISIGMKEVRVSSRANNLRKLWMISCMIGKNRKGCEMGLMYDGLSLENDSSQLMVSSHVSSMITGKANF